MKTIILASASPRRKEILKRAGLKFHVEVSDYEEDSTLDLEPSELAKYLSLQKAKDVTKNYKNAIIIAADTFVILEKETIGKPKNEADAKRILKKLSGKPHLIITGFTIIDTDTQKTVSKSVATTVYMKKMSEEEIDAYVGTKEPLDKAGAYGIQELGGIFIEKIEGDYFNIVGLPLFPIVKSLNEFGITALKILKNKI